MSCTCNGVGDLDRRITIDEPTYAQDSSNEQIPTWSQYSKQWANCRAAGARDVVQAEQVLGAGTWILTMQKSKTTMNITGEMRARWTDYRDIVAYFDGPAMPVAKTPDFVQIKAVEQTA